jgi:hypothetical protein
MKYLKEALLNRPWLLIIAGYLFAMSAWVVMVTIAVRHQSPEVAITSEVHP